MIQDIAPSMLSIAYAARTAAPEDVLLLFDGSGRLYVCTEGGRIRFPTLRELPADPAVYLFSLDDTRCFLAREIAAPSLPGFDFQSVRQLRDQDGGKELFAAFTAFHLWRWYADNRFCGRCAGRMLPHETERALICPDCGNIVYPRINPAVIVGVIRDDCLLITRYRKGFAHNALVAGFAEIGETLEQTVAREVMEETGLEVRNIRYYKSQPWGMAQDLLAGFYCDALPGSIRMDAGELKYADWVRREDIVLQPTDLSLTNEMMKRFMRGDPC